MVVVRLSRCRISVLLKTCSDVEKRTKRQQAPIISDNPPGKEDRRYQGSTIARNNQQHRGISCFPKHLSEGLLFHPRE